MKVLSVTPFYVPAYGFGGPVAVAHAIAKQVVDQGVEVDVLTTDVLDQANRVGTLEETIDGVAIKRLRNISPKLAKNFNLYTPMGTAAFVKKNLSKYQVVHFHAFFTYLNAYTALRCRKQGIPYILHLHESPVPLAVLGKVAIKKVFNLFWGKRMLLGAARIVVVSTREKELLTEYLPELSSKVSVVPNQLPLELPTTKATRADFGFSDDNKVVVCLSRLGRIKRLDRVIRAIGQLVETDKSYRLVIAGPDEANTKIELDRLVAELSLGEYVKFPGYVDAVRRSELLSVADVYALFSAYESFSVSTLEALHYNVPVCLGREVGVAPDVIPYGCGVMVENTEDAKQASDGLRKVVNNRSAMSGRCQVALQQFSSVNLGKTFATLYAELVANK